MSPCCRPRGSGSPVLVLALSLCASLLAGVAGAATSTWINSAGGMWSEPSNWSPAVVPAGAGQTAVLPALSGPYVVTLDLDPAVDALQIDAAGPTLDLAGRSIGAIASTTNAGTIRGFRGALNSNLIHNASTGVIETAENDSIVVSGNLDNAGTIVVGVTSSVRSIGHLILDGGGTLRLEGTATIRSPNSNTVPGDYLTIQAGSALRGSGGIQMYVKNYGLLESDGNFGNEIGIGGLVFNYGTMRVQNGGRINVNRPLLKNYNGRIEAGPGGGRFTLLMPFGAMGSIDNLRGGAFITDGGDLSVRCLGVFGGEVRNASGGIVDFEMSNPQNLVVTAGAEVVVSTLMDLTASGSSLRNNGTVRVPGRINVGGDATNGVSLSGTGVLVLEGGILDTPAGAILINEAGHTISGCGTISANLMNYGTVESDCFRGTLTLSGTRITNRQLFRAPRGTLWITGATTRAWNMGTISVEGGTLWFGGGATLENTGGTIWNQAGTLELGMRGAGTVIGGTLKTSGTSVLENSRTVTLKNVTLAPGAELVTKARATTTVSGSRFVNQGTNRIASGGAFKVDPSADYLQTAGATVLEGGRLLATRDVRIQGGALRGAGTVAANVENGGELIPELGASSLTIEGNYRQLATGTLSVVLAGTEIDQVSRLRVTGDVVLDGAVSAAAVGSFQPAAGQVFDVLSYRSSSGSLAECRSLDVGDAIEFQAVDAGDHLELQTFGLLPVNDPPARAPITLRFFGARSARRTSFVVDLPQAAAVAVRVYDAAGREVATLADGAREAGTHTFALANAGQRLRSGVYFARLEMRIGDATTVRTARAVVLE